MSAKIVLTIGKRKLEFTPEEARKVHDELGKALNPPGQFQEIIERIREIKDRAPVIIPQPYPVPVYRDPDPYWRYPQYPTITCQAQSPLHFQGALCRTAQS